MKTIAYIRVSTSTQDLEQQKMTIHDYAYKNQIVIDEYMQVQISSKKTPQQRRIEELLEKLQPGDRLIVSELSRLGRSLGEIVRFVDYLIKNQIIFNALKENLTIHGKQDMQGKIMVTLFGLFSEIERDLISERTKHALKTARLKGRQLGRPKGTIGKSKLDGKEADINELLNKLIPKASIAKIMGVSRTTIVHFIESRRIALNN